MTKKEIWQPDSTLSNKIILITITDLFSMMYDHAATSYQIKKINSVSLPVSLFSFLLPFPLS